jgi:hypothetical protein
MSECNVTLIKKVIVARADLQLVHFSLYSLAARSSQESVGSPAPCFFPAGDIFQQLLY